MKFKQTFTDHSGGMQIPVTLERVVEIADGAEVPQGAVEVPVETEAYDWREVH